MDWVILSTTGRLARVDLPGTVWEARAAQELTRVDHDVLASAAPVTEGYVAAVTTTGMAYRILAQDLPVLVPGGPWSLWDAPEVDSMVASGHVVGLYSLDVDAPPLALGTKSGVVKRVVPEYKGWESWEIAGIKEGDEIVGVAHASDSADLIFITTEAQLLRLSAREVRPQGRPAGGMAGIKLGEGAHVIFFTAVSKEDRDQAIVATLASGPEGVSTVKTTVLSDYPSKGRATSGVRTHRFLKGQDHLVLGWVGLPPVRACSTTGTPRNLPSTEDRRDGGGTKVYGPFQSFG